MGASVAASVAVIATMAAQIAALAESSKRVLSAPGRPGGPFPARTGDHSGRPGAGRVRRRAEPLCQRQVSQKLCRHVADHSGLGHQKGGDRPATSATIAWPTHLLWAFAALTASPGARAFYDQHRAAGDTHHAALRALSNRLVGILHGCLDQHSRYDEHIAWGHRANKVPQAA